MPLPINNLWTRSSPYMESYFSSSLYLSNITTFRVAVMANSEARNVLTFPFDP